MLFRYNAVDNKGIRYTGEIDANSVNAVLEFLAGKNLKPINVQPLNIKKGLLSIGFGKEKVSLADKVFMFKYLSLMLKVGTDLFKAIDILVEDFPSGPVKRLLLEIRSNLEKGTPFSNAFAMHPEAFPSVITNLIKAGETSGNLELVLNQISQDLEKERELSSKIKSALTYPLILLVTSFGMTFFLVTFLVPKMAQSFMNAGTKMPIYTKIILTVGMFLNKNLIIVLPVIIISVVGLFMFLRTVNGKKIVSALGDKVAVVRNLTDKMALQRMTSVLSSLIKAGMPIIGALEITAEAVSHPKFKNALTRIARESLPKGVKIGDAFRQEKIFPAVLTNLMLVGEKAGHTEEILDSLAIFYANEIDAGLKTLVAFIEPMLLLLIGVIVGGLALAVIVPVYQMVGQF